MKSSGQNENATGTKWYGWGYTDSEFVVKNEEIFFNSNRYELGKSASPLPYLKTFVTNQFNVDIANPTLPAWSDFPATYPDSLISEEFLNELKLLHIAYSVEGADRLRRSHGQTVHEIFVVRTKKLPARIPDAIIWPEKHEDVCEIVRLAKKYNTVIVPFGGGTCVSGAVSCPNHESRPIVAVDTARMNRLLRLNVENLTATFEAGITGQRLEETLRARGFTVGHEPDSYEFSSLGGWVATRASGMKKNTYGNIEDLVVGYRFVTATGILEKCYDTPRMSCGPDFAHIVLGSEGTLGMVTEVTLKIRPAPAFQKYNSFAFRDFESGVRCVREIARQRCQPASIRLMDNLQLKFGEAMKSKLSTFAQIKFTAQKFYLYSIKNWDMDNICFITLLFEGQQLSDIKDNLQKISQICVSFGGVCAGETTGKIGYDLTFIIAYIRDLALTYRIIGESFETSVPWDNALALCTNVKRSVQKKCKDFSIEHYLISCRITQTYDTGCCIYFYFAYNWANQKDPVTIFEDIESLAREEIMKVGGSLSHHHGIGKIRSKFYQSQVSNYGVGLYKVIKQFVDPDNIFGVGNILSHL